MFCTFCGKALPAKSSPVPSIQPALKAKSSSKKASAPKIRVSFTAIKAIITGLLVVGLVIVVLLIYYPNALPWNW